MKLLVLYWILYYAVHSLLAAPSLKAALFARWSAAVRFYRLAYNQLSVWLFLAVLHYQLALPARPLWGASVAVLVVGGALLLMGAAGAVLALRGYDLGEFAGWRYVRRGAAAGVGPLRTTGLNAAVRHPLYLGILVGLAGWVLLQATAQWLVFGGCAAGYVVVGTQWEERKLRAAVWSRLPRLRPPGAAIMAPLVPPPPILGWGEVAARPDSTPEQSEPPAKASKHL